MRKSSLPDLALLAVPLPTLRPVVDDMTVASVPAGIAPVILSSLVVGRSAAGDLLVTKQHKISMAGRRQR
jgi:hypothetical protein